MKELKINYNNDIYFKHLLSCNDDKSQMLRKVIISDEFNIRYNLLKVINPIINDDHLNEKTTILDILLENDNKENINLEMQVSSIDEYEYKRFQLYGANMLSSQIEKGESYHTLQKSFQIIFCTGKLNFDSLWTMYTSKDSSNNNEPYNLIHRVYVNMPYIDKIMETKGRENLSNFEKIILIFQYGIKNGIIMYKGEAINMMDDPIVRAMEEKMNEVTNDKALRAYAFSREMGRMQHLHQQETLKKQEEMIKSEKEMIKSEKEEIKLEKEEIKTKQEKLDLKKEELNSKETELNSKETELNSKQNEIELREQNMLKFISKQYNCSLEEAKEILKNM